jgi:hypothetical protein
MNNQESDSIVFFGASGDLAYKQIFSSSWANPELSSRVARLNPAELGRTRPKSRLRAYISCRKTLPMRLAGPCRNLSKLSAA